MARVVITKDQLQAAKACPVYVDSPEWDSSQEALVYADWDSTVQRLLSTKRDTQYLDFLVLKQLVPMTKDEFIQARKNARSRQ